AAVEQDRGALDDLVGETVVEVGVHLLDELLVGQRRQSEVLAVLQLLTHRRPSVGPNAIGMRFHDAELNRIMERDRISPPNPRPAVPTPAGRRRPPRPPPPRRRPAPGTGTTARGRGRRPPRCRRR